MQRSLKNKAGIDEAVNICLDRDVHFAAYRLPGEKDVSLIIQKDPVIHPVERLDEKLPRRGFLIAPFSRENNKTWLIRPDMVMHGSVNNSQLEELYNLPARHHRFMASPHLDDTRYADYIKLIEGSLRHIMDGDFEKVVLSRVKSVFGQFRPQIATFFHSLCNSYPHAFVYLFCVKGQCWTGATPEPFICSDDHMLKTVSLAGTRPYSADNMDISRWNHKELEEQEYVTRHIEKILKNYHIDDYTLSEPYVDKAGNLLHLRTDFTFPAASAGDRLPSLINSLHPTPAVCGMSTGKAMDFIRNAEKHNREYYAGFLGPLGMSEMIRLYVNLRCLKVFDDRLILFIGGGITRESVPHDEWDETEIKADTLLSVLNQIR